MKRIGLLLGVVIILCSTQILQAKERKDIPDWTLGAGLSGTNGMYYFSGYHFKLHHVFSNLISGGPEFTLNAPSDQILFPDEYSRIFNWQLDFVVSTAIRYKRFSVSPVLGFSINKHHHQTVIDNVLQPAKYLIDTEYGLAYGANLQYQFLRWGVNGSNLSLLLEYRNSTNAYGGHQTILGINYYFFLKEMP